MSAVLGGQETAEKVQKRTALLIVLLVVLLVGFESVEDEILLGKLSLQLVYLALLGRDEHVLLHDPLPQVRDHFLLLHKLSIISYRLVNIK